MLSSCRCRYWCFPTYFLLYNNNNVIQISRILFSRADKTYCYWISFHSPSSISRNHLTPTCSIHLQYYWCFHEDLFIFIAFFVLKILNAYCYCIVSLRGDVKHPSFDFKRLTVLKYFEQFFLNASFIEHKVP